MLPGGPGQGRPLRRLVLHRRHDHRHLLPAELPGDAPRKRRNVRVLPERGGRAAGRVPGLQALPTGRRPGLAGVGPPRRPGRPGDAADRRRGGRPGRGRRAGAPARLQRAPAAPAAGRRGRRRPASRSPGRSARRPRGCCSRPPTCRSPRSRSPPASPASGSSTTPCARSSRSPRRELRPDRSPATDRRSRPARSRCGCRTGRRSTLDGCCASSAPVRCRASRTYDGRRVPAEPAAAARRRRIVELPPGSDHVRRDAAAGRPARPGPRPCRGAGGCSTWTPTRWRSTRRSAPTRCSAPLVRGAPGVRVPGHGRRRRDGGPGGARPAGLGRRRPHGWPAGSPSVRHAAGTRRTAALTHTFPTADALAAGRPRSVAADASRCRRAAAALRGARRRAGRRRGRPRPRRRPRRDRAAAAGAARASGRGPATTCAMRALRDPDVFLPDRPRRPPRRSSQARPAGRPGVGRRARRRAGGPWRSYALLHLWHVACEPRRKDPV